MTHFEESFIRQIEIIKEAANAGKLVLFVGAGVSQNSGIPGWNHLTEELIKDLTGIPYGEYSAQVIAQMYFNQFGKRAYIDKVKRILNVELKKPNPIHNLLFDLNPRHILTTNYDNLIEQTAYENQHAFSVVAKDTGLPTAQYIQLIVKVHGDFSDGGENIVLKEDDYLHYTRNYPLIKSFIESLFASSVILFIGYGYRDDNLKQIIDQVQVYLGGNSHQAYLVRTEPTSNQIELDYFSKKNIKIISYFKEMSDYLNVENNPHTQDLKKDSWGLNDKGINLFTALNFITRFDPKIYRFSSGNIVSQCLSSLEPIRKELSFIPPFHLRNLYPFNKEQHNWLNDYTSYNYDDKNYSLTTKNEELISLFNAIKTDDNDNFEAVSDEYVKDLLPTDLRIDEKTRLKNKFKSDLSTLIQVLNGNLILSFSTATLPKVSISNAKKINAKHQNDKHDTLIMFLRFEFSSAFKKVEGMDSRNLSARGHLELGYTFYQLKDYKRACIEFQFASRIAWDERLYIIYTIASTNIKKLLRGLKFNSSESEATIFIKDAINKSGVRRIHETVYNLDLNQTERELIRYIVEGEMEDSVSNKVREMLFEVRKLSQTDKKWSIPLRYDLETLFLYLHRNSIIYDLYTNFSNIVKDGIESYCYHYVKCNPRIPFDCFFIELAVLYIGFNDLNIIFRRTEIETIKLFPEQIRYTVTKINNLFKSAYYTDSFGQVTPNRYNEDQVLFGFRNRLEAIIPTALLILSKMDLPSNHFEILMKNLIDVIKIRRGNNLNYLPEILWRHQAAFSQEHLDTLLIILLDYDMALDSISTITDIFQARSSNYLISNPKVLDKIHSLDFRGEQDLPFVLYTVSNDETKEFLKQKVEERMAEIFVEDDYRSSVLLDMIDPRPLLSVYLKKILQNTEKRQIPLLPGFSNNQTRINHWHYSFIIKTLIEKHHLEFKDELGQLLSKSNHFKWLFDPANFGYEKFNKEWLRFERSDWFINRLRGIEPLKRKLKEIIKEDEDEELAYFCSDYFF